MNIWPIYVLSLYEVPVHVLTPYVHIHIFSRGTVTNNNPAISPSAIYRSEINFDF